MTQTRSVSSRNQFTRWLLKLLTTVSDQLQTDARERQHNDKDVCYPQTNKQQTTNKTNKQNKTKVKHEERKKALELRKQTKKQTHKETNKNTTTKN